MAEQTKAMTSLQSDIDQKSDLLVTTKQKVAAAESSVDIERQNAGRYLNLVKALNQRVKELDRKILSLKNQDKVVVFRAGERGRQQ